MKKYLGFVVVSVFLLSCTNTDRDNPYDMWAFNYIGNVSAEDSSSSVETGDEPSSSSEESPPSSSSVEPSSSSAEPSSSSEESLPSSSSAEPSSSSVEPSSSSEAESSSSVAPSSSSVGLSSSSALPSSSSVAPSSSSVVPSSSSTAPSSSSNAVSSSSSYGGLCEGFVEGTEREHYGKMKKQFCDERDGKKYVYVTLGWHTWMAENLNYNAPDSRCYLDDDDNCVKYGRLYIWSQAVYPPSLEVAVCPTGWHLSSSTEWNMLIEAIGSSDAGKKLKTTSGWNNNGNGTDNYGFSALPGGNYMVNSFVNVGSSGFWWDDNPGGYRRIMNYNSDNVSRSGGIQDYKHGLCYVRCVRD